MFQFQESLVIYYFQSLDGGGHSRFNSTLDLINNKVTKVRHKTINGFYQTLHSHDNPFSSFSTSNIKHDFPPWELSEKSLGKVIANQMQTPRDQFKTLWTLVGSLTDSLETCPISGIRNPPEDQNREYSVVIYLSIKQSSIHQNTPPRLIVLQKKYVISR